MDKKCKWGGGLSVGWPPTSLGNKSQNHPHIADADADADAGADADADA